MKKNKRKRKKAVLETKDKKMKEKKMDQRNNRVMKTIQGKIKMKKLRIKITQIKKRQDTNCESNCM